MIDCIRTNLANTTADTMSQLNSSDEEAIPPVITKGGGKHIAATKRVLADPEAVAKVSFGEERAHLCGAHFANAAADTRTEQYRYVVRPFQSKHSSTSRNGTPSLRRIRQGSRKEPGIED